MAVFFCPTNEFSLFLLAGFHSAAIGYNGTLFTWGVGMYGALGHGDDTPSVVKEPCAVDIPASLKEVICLAD